MSQSDAFFEAITAGDAESVRRMLQERPDRANARNAAGVSAVLHACYQGQAEIAAAMASKRADLDVFESAALGQIERLGELLEADPAACNASAPDGFAPLHLAAYFAGDDTVRLLIEHGADPNAVTGNAMALRPIHSASVRGQTAIVTRLLDAGADVNAAQHGGWTPLHAAAHAGNEELVGLLLNRGANRAAKSDDGQTPVDIASARGHEAIAVRIRDFDT